MPGPLGLYVQSAMFRKYTAETKRNYATDIALLLPFLWGRGRAWSGAMRFGIWSPVTASGYASRSCTWVALAS